jgi:hypothetical protein
MDVMKKAAQRAGSYPQTIFLFSWAACEKLINDQTKEF